MTGRSGLGWAVASRVPPLALAGLGLLLFVALVAMLADPAPDGPPWWSVAVFLVPTVTLALGGVALVVDPRPLLLRQVTAAAGILWLLVAAGLLLLGLAAGTLAGDEGAVAIAVFAVVDAAALLALAATTRHLADEQLPGPLGRVATVVVFAIAIAAASVVLVVVVSVALALWDAIATGTVSDRLPWAAVGLVVALPAVTFAIVALLTRRAAGGTFYAQAAANLRNSLLLLVTLVAVVAATAEIIAVALTFEPIPGLWAAGIAALVGLGAALAADYVGADIVLSSAGARPADARRDAMLLNVVREVSLAAGIPAPRVYVVEDGSMNAFATGRRPDDAAVAVTRGLLDRLDREQLQGVIGHELGHVRNYDTRYALYVAILVGLVALVTDGFLRGVLHVWREGGFFWSSDDAKGAAAAFVSGIAVGLFLLAVAIVLRLVAPLFSMLVQAAVSREREFLADATSVELTRNPAGLQRALAAIAGDRDELDSANRGTQHLWFRNPVKAGSDRRVGLFSTHPSIGARIERLARLSGAPLPPAIATDGLDEET
jgi:heat shock protein HtpX